MACAVLRGPRCSNAPGLPGGTGPPAAEIRAFSPVNYVATARNLPAFRIANGDADCVVRAGQARELQKALTGAGAVSTLVILHGAGHEDPEFMATQMTQTFALLDRTFGRQVPGPA